MKKQDCFYLGKIIKKYSFKGEVLIKIDSDLSKNYFDLKNVLIENDKGLIPFFIKKIRLHKPDIFRIKFKDVDSEELANKILKKNIYLPLSSLPTLSGKKFYFHEVIGFKALNNNKIIGIIKNINDKSPQATFKIKHNNKLILVPIHDDFIIKINRKEKKIELNLPDGLLDLQN
jgi:16S rRNA processing protein RimM